MQRLSVTIVQQGVWDMPLESMPLAAGYLKAMVDADEVTRGQVEVRIRNLRGQTTNAAIAQAALYEETPDVLAFSVLGWNYRAFIAVAETFKELNPRGVVVFGGNHVSHQAARVFRETDAVDVVVNGEGELTFRDVVRRLVDRPWPLDLTGTQGISWRAEDRETRTEDDRPRIDDLDIIPSPVLTGAIDLTDSNGRFRYDVALLETNRGCPYKCAFCYWGGAVGQRVRAFSRERLREEIELFARHGVHTIVACDANFGMLPIDEDFLEDMIEVREQYGCPRAFETSWAKNKSKVFYNIVRRMKEVGLRSSFTLALQTLDATALEAMNRRNMKVNDWQDLVEWLTAEGLDLYAELIWGSPGETVETFLRGYDELSEKVSRIAVYPMMLLPNTDFSERRSEFDIVALRGDSDDFEYILSHSTMSFDDDLRMQTFMFWARVIAENAVLRHIWRPLRQFGGMTQTKALDSLAQWIAESSSPAAKFVRIKCLQVKGGGAPAYAEVISFFFLTQDGENLLDDWWHGAVVPQLSAESEPFLSEVLRFDLLTCPVPGADAGATFAEGTVKTPPPLQDVEGEQFYVNGPIRFSYDIPVALESLRRGDTKLPAPRKADLTIYYREGALNAIMSTNHEEIVHFMGETDLARVLVPRGGAQEVG